MNSEALKGHLDLLLLAAVQLRPVHGYAIAETLRARSDGAFDLPEGTLCPALSNGTRPAGGRSLVGGEWSPPRLSIDREGAARTRRTLKSVARLQPRDLRGREGDGVSSPSVAQYVLRLSRALQREGLVDPRIVDLSS
jgi:hypothetical protein